MIGHTHCPTASPLHVNMANDPQGDFVLMFNRVSFSNTILVTSDLQRVYTVTTEVTLRGDKELKVTCIRNARNELIAALESSDVSDDSVTIAGKEPMSVRDWLKASRKPFGNG